MRLIINGEAKECEAQTLQELLSELSLEKSKVVCELNSQVVPHENYSETQLHSDDVLEFVQFVGGG